jgi:hypothetical protein
VLLVKPGPLGDLYLHRITSYLGEDVFVHWLVKTIEQLAAVNERSNSWDIMYIEGKSLESPAFRTALESFINANPGMAVAIEGLPPSVSLEDSVLSTATHFVEASGIDDWLAMMWTMINAVRSTAADS